MADLISVYPFFNNANRLIVAILTIEKIELINKRDRIANFLFNNITVIEGV
jgi:hypothetical protein